MEKCITAFGLVRSFVHINKNKNYDLCYIKIYLTNTLLKQRAGRGDTVPACTKTSHTYLEFHGAEPVEDISHMLLDHGPGDLVVALSCGLHRMPCHVIESNRVGENAHCLIEWTEPAEKSQKTITSDFQPIKPFRNNRRQKCFFPIMSNLKCVCS